MFGLREASNFSGRRVADMSLWILAFVHIEAMMVAFVAALEHWLFHAEPDDGKESQGQGADAQHRNSLER